MIDHIRGVPVTIHQSRRIEAIQTFVILFAYQKEIRKLERIGLSLGIESNPDGSIQIDGNFFEADLSSVKCLDALGHREFRRQLDRPMFATANTFKDEDREIAFHFVEVAAVPVAKFTLFVEECDCPPFALVVDEFGALDWLRVVKDSLKIRIPEPSENAAQLDEELPVVSLGLGGGVECHEEAQKD